MRRFACPVCGAEVHFDSLSCLSCGTALVYAPRRATHLALGGEDAGPCANRAQIGCNWRADSTDGAKGGALCASCALTETIPDLSVLGNAARWARIEEAKRRLVYSLVRLGLPLVSGAGNRLLFRLLGDEMRADGSVRHVLTGHEDGVVTLNIAEADDAVREAMRVEMGEPYRTLLGHFRHEVGHFYYDVLVEEGRQLLAFETVFGDPGEDYAAALRRHYADGAPAGWPETHVSAYATAHPWEDFAETFAHWLHMTDGLETAVLYGLSEDVDPYGAAPMERLLGAWIPLSIAMNAMNRAMGQADFYPFVIAPQVAGKLAFVHGLIAPRLEAAA
jgi:hypothetical protein